VNLPKSPSTFLAEWVGRVGFCGTTGEVCNVVRQKSIPHCCRIVACNLSGSVTLLDMLKRYAFSFYEVVSRIEYLRHEAKVLGQGSAYVTPTTVYEHTVNALKATLAEMRAECEKLDLIPTTDLISHIESEIRLKEKTYNYADLSNHLDTLCFSFATELRKNSCFRIAAENDKYFEKDDLFGPKVSKAFGSCSDEIRNAGNCYALEQYDATAFHSMRILERGLGSLAKKFSVDFGHINWHNVIEQVEKKIRQMDARSLSEKHRGLS
jgi:hypothetical protein